MSTQSYPQVGFMRVYNIINMKIIAIGDTHGRSDWKRIVEENKDADKIVFVGDYFDTHENISHIDQIVNFNDIVEFKRENMDRVVLLVGNHDYHYLDGVKGKYSGYNPLYATRIGLKLEEAKKDGLLQFCYQDGKFLFSHAGVTKTWLQAENPFGGNIEEYIRGSTLEAFEFNQIDVSGWGENIAQSPIWVRPFSLVKDAIEGYFQVVGHTTQRNLLITDKFAFIDCINTSGEYLVIENGEVKASK